MLAPEPALIAPLAEGSASVEVRRWRDRSVVTSVGASSPMRVLTPKNHGSFAWLYLSTLGGGLVQGDRVSLGLDVGAGAEAMVSSQGWTRVYGGSGSTLSLDASVGPGATLVWLPDPTACFAGAHFEQRSTLELAADASLLYLDVLCAGRSARGERWAFSRVRSELDLRVGGRTRAHETTLLDPRHGALAQRLGRFEALATLVLTGPRFTPCFDTLEAAINVPFAATGLSAPDALASASRLGPDTLLVRFADTSVERLQQRLRDALDFLPSQLGDDPFARRF